MIPPCAEPWRIYLVPDLRFFESIGSTNDEAMAWADAGAEDWSLVVADQQTQGRGRLGRHWVTNPGAALAFSLVLRPSREEMAFASLFSPLGGMGVASALEEIGLAALVKWPNDVLLNRRKVCGILGEAAWTGDRLNGMVLGIGVNVASESVPPAGELLFPATCVEAELGRPLDRQESAQANPGSSAALARAARSGGFPGVPGRNGWLSAGSR